MAPSPPAQIRAVLAALLQGFHRAPPDSLLLGFSMLVIDRLEAVKDDDMDDATR